MARSLLARLVAAVAVVLVSVPATQAQTPGKYGELGTFSEKEVAEASKYGGLPNTKMFNGRTSCRSLVSLYDEPNMNKNEPEMVAFMRYGRHLLMGLDIVSAHLRGALPAITVIDAKTWEQLPSWAYGYCRNHPGVKVEDALLSIYQFNRTSHGLPPIR